VLYVRPIEYVANSIEFASVLCNQMSTSYSLEDAHLSFLRINIHVGLAENEGSGSCCAEVDGI
jgi:hypothetical protein